MFFNKTYKAKKEKELINLSLSELVEKYRDTNYVDVTFRENGDVSVWIAGSLKNEDE